MAFLLGKRKNYLNNYDELNKKIKIDKLNSFIELNNPNIIEDIEKNDFESVNFADENYEFGNDYEEIYQKYFDNKEDIMKTNIIGDYREIDNMLDNFFYKELEYKELEEDNVFESLKHTNGELEEANVFESLKHTDGELEENNVFESLKHTDKELEEDNVLNDSSTILEKNEKIEDENREEETRIIKDIKYHNEKFGIIYNYDIEVNKIHTNKGLKIFLKLSESDFKKIWNENELMIKIKKINGEEIEKDLNGIKNIRNQKIDKELFYKKNKKYLLINLRKRKLPISKLYENFPFIVSIEIGKKCLTSKPFYTKAKMRENKSELKGSIDCINSFYKENITVPINILRLGLDNIIKDNIKVNGTINDNIYLYKSAPGNPRYTLQIDLPIIKNTETYKILNQFDDDSKCENIDIKLYMMKDIVNTIPKVYDISKSKVKYFDYNSSILKKSLKKNKNDLTLSVFIPKKNFIKKNKTMNRLDWFNLPLSTNHENYSFRFIFEIENNSNEIYRTKPYLIKSK